MTEVDAAWDNGVTVEEDCAAPWAHTRKSASPTTTTRFVVASSPRAGLHLQNRQAALDLRSIVAAPRKATEMRRMPTSPKRKGCSRSRMPEPRSNDNRFAGLRALGHSNNSNSMTRSRTSVEYRGKHMYKMRTWMFGACYKRDLFRSLRHSAATPTNRTGHFWNTTTQGSIQKRHE